jgi:signal transduction histidine kinase
MKSGSRLFPRRLAFFFLPNRFFGSLRFRLLLWGAAILVLVLAVFSALVYYRQVEYQQAVLSSQIQAQAGFILETYRVFFDNAGGRDGLSLASVFPELQEGIAKKSLVQPKGVVTERSAIQPGEVLLMLDQDGQVTGRAGGLDDTDVVNLSRLAVKKAAEGSLFSFFFFPIMSPEEGQPPVDYLFVRTSAPLSSTQSAVLLLGATFDPAGQLPGLARSLVLASLIVLGLSLVGGYWLTGRLMQPVQAITRTAQEINANDLTRRLNLGKQDELGELADTFDRMLDRLERAFERQRQFTAHASHDLRTPLTIINLEVNRILEDPLTRPELHRSLGVIRDENERMTHLVNNLLVLARADAGSARLKQERLDISELALDVVERLIPLSQRHAVALSTGEMPPVMVSGDRFYLSQMVANLVENAIKYGAGEERKVWVETGCRAAGANRDGWLRVEDHGPGIAGDHLPYLFDRFYRADPFRANGIAGDGEPAEPADGHGLGLSIVQWVARAHGGDVQVSSQVGRGAVFEVILPMAE